MTYQMMIPTEKQIENELKTIYLDGSMKITYETIKFHIEHVRMHDKTDVTWDIILSSYKDHIDQWNYKWKKKEDAGFLPKQANEERKNLNEFVNEELYNRQWIIVRGDQSRNNYLFPNIPLDEITKQRKAFEKEIKSNR